MIMDLENYKEGQSMQRPPLFDANCFTYWKNRFETYVKSKDIDLWHIIVYGDYKPTIKNKDTGKEEVIPYEKYEEYHKKMISKNDKAKMVLYNALPKKEYEKIFMCKTAKDVWNSLIITHQALPTKWRPKLTTIEESKDLLTLPLDEFICNLKVYEVVLEKDSEASKKNRFETYVKSKDIDLWHIIVYGDYKPTIKNKDTGKEEVIPYEKYEEYHKKMISKNDKAKMVLYNALPKKEYEKIFMYKTAKDVWNSLIITHQALPTKWRSKLTTIEESKDLLTLPLDELICNLKVYEVVLEKDSEASKVKKKNYKSLDLKERKVSSDEEESC
nr:DUF4219 domain-containing protein/UBN2 domain-containing protein [Tanacetum cinerariifolium]